MKYNVVKVEKRSRLSRLLDQHYKDYTAVVKLEGRKGLLRFNFCSTLKGGTVNDNLRFYLEELIKSMRGPDLSTIEKTGTIESL